MCADSHKKWASFYSLLCNQSNCCAVYWDGYEIQLTIIEHLLFNPSFLLFLRVKDLLMDDLILFLKTWIEILKLFYCVSRPPVRVSSIWGVGERGCKLYPLQKNQICEKIEKYYLPIQSHIIPKLVHISCTKFLSFFFANMVLSSNFRKDRFCNIIQYMLLKNLYLYISMT